MQWKIAVITLMLLGSGCIQETSKLQPLRKSGPIKWVKVGTLVSVGPDMEPTRRPSRVGTAILGETKLSRTRVETTKGVYIVSDKIGIVEIGTPVSVGYDSSNEYSDTPLYLSFGGKRYEIAL